jgi:hypothetical protein
MYGFLATSPSTRSYSASDQCSFFERTRIRKLSSPTGNFQTYNILRFPFTNSPHLLLHHKLTSFSSQTDDIQDSNEKIHPHRQISCKWPHSMNIQPNPQVPNKLPLPPIVSNPLHRRYNPWHKDKMSKCKSKTSAIPPIRTQDLQIWPCCCLD